MSADRSQGVFSTGELVAERYHIEELLGQGGTGIVYRATHTTLHRPVAVKVLLPQRQSMAIYRARFEREAKVASALRHPAAVEIFDFGVFEGVPFLVMDLLTGPTLREALQPQGEPMELEKALKVGRAVVDLLTAAHHMGLVHRDLKPENIFLEPVERPGRPVDFQAVVVDFGLAYIEDDADRGRITETGMMSGTPQYMSPEQCRAKGVGAASDMYAVGCILYELFTGQVPFDGTLFEVMSAHLYSPPTPPGQTLGAKDLPRVLEDLVMRLLRKRPSDRPTAGDVLRVLDAVSGQTRRRERGRDVRLLGERATRMIATPPPTTASATRGHIPSGGVAIGLAAPIAQDISMALKINGLLPMEMSGPEEDGPPVVLALGLELSSLEAWASGKRRVIASADPGDVERLTALLRLGVDEVVSESATAAEIVSRVRRAARRARR